MTTFEYDQYAAFNVNGYYVNLDVGVLSDLPPKLFAYLSPLTGGSPVVCRPNDLRKLADEMDAWEEQDMAMREANGLPLSPADLK